MKMCNKEMNPKSFLSNFLGSLNINAFCDNHFESCINLSHLK